MPASVADIPDVFDVIINGVGYLYDKRREDQAQLGHTPTFVPRNNTSGAYGDNEQDFFLTGSQKDWSGGEGQKHWNIDEERSNRYWSSTGILIQQPGQFSLMPTMRHPAVPGVGVRAAIGFMAQHYAVTNTNLWTISQSGQIDQGAHGAGVPCRFGMAWDGVALYVAGATAIRRWDGTSWSTFSTQANAGSLAFLNNQLYSCDANTLRVYSTTGVPTDIFTWLDAKGVPYPIDIYTTTPKPKLHTYGANMLIYWTRVGATRPELWMYDGEGTFRTAQLPIGIAGDIAESNGVVYLSSAESVDNTEAAWTTPGGVIYAWVNGSIQEVYREEYGAGVTPPQPISIPALGVLSGTLVFSTKTGAGTILKRYVLETGAAEPIGNINNTAIDASSHVQISSAISSICLTGDQVAGHWFFPNLFDNTVTRTGNLCSSFFDFGSSLKKLFRNVTVDFDPAAGGRVDIGYRIDGSVNGPYTTLQTNAQPGVDYFLPDNTQGKAMQVQITLTASGITTASPVVRRVYVRAAPFHQSYRKAIYHLDLSSYRGKTPVMRRDGAADARSGKEMAQTLYAVVTGEQSVTIIDALSSYSGILDPDGFQITQFNPDEFVATVSARQV